jgi:hypothetical protein
VAAHAVSWSFFDVAHDGLAYFQPSIRRIAAGFNPLYDGYMDLGRAPDLWSEQATYFPKAMGYFAASVVAAMGDIQIGKAYHLLLLASSLFFVWNFAKEEGPLKKGLWVLMALNPITVTQWASTIIDGALASLSLIGLVYAIAFFERKTISRTVHLIGIMALTLLFCVKSTGFAFGSIIIFCIGLHRFFVVWCDLKGRSTVSRLWKAFGAMTFLGLRLGGRVLLLVSVLGFHPYITNLLQHKNIFYPAVRSTEESVFVISSGLDDIAKNVYPSASNRFTRLLYSIASRPLKEVAPAEQKNPLSAPFDDWDVFGYAYNLRAGAMGPLFFLLVLTTLILRCFFRKETQGWALFTLFLMLFIQPHAWQMRYAPFVWCVPLVALLSVPAKREYLLLIPLLVAAANVGGVVFFHAGTQVSIARKTLDLLLPRRGGTVLLEKSIFEYDGVFDRYSMRQKFVNPEETFFYRFPGLALLGQNPDGLSVNMFFEEELPPPPDFPLVFSDDAILPWMLMSDGIAPLMDETAYPPVERWRSYNNRIKLYMRMMDRPRSDWLLTLKGMPWDVSSPRKRSLSVWVFVNNQVVGHWIADETGNGTTLTIPRKLLEESFEDSPQLLTLMLCMPEVSARGGDASPLGLEMKELYLRPASGDAPALPSIVLPSIEEIS